MPTPAWSRRGSAVQPGRPHRQRAVDRAAAGGPLDTRYLAHLSADALPALAHLPFHQRDAVLPVLRSKLTRADGIAGLNLARARAR